MNRHLAVVALLAVGCSSGPTRCLEPDPALCLDGGASSRLPTVTFVIDRSGTMNRSVSTSGPCLNCPNAPCPSDCISRISELKSGFDLTLGLNPFIAHFGMVPFPSDEVSSCSGPDNEWVGRAGLSVDPNATDGSDTLAAETTLLRSRIAALTAAGGSPTTATLEWVQNVATRTVGDGRSVVVLVTDGASSCSLKSTPNPSSCRCTVPTGADQVCRTDGINMCDDADNTTAAIAALAAAGTRTAVIGFGNVYASASTTESEQLSDWARAGGMLPTCETDADCGSGNTCGSAMTRDFCNRPVKTCSRPLRANNGNELAFALSDIAVQLVCPK